VKFENPTYRTAEEACDAARSSERERRYEEAAIASIWASDFCESSEGAALWMQQAQVYATLHHARVTAERIEVLR
jgi:hypothetical protein